MNKSQEIAGSISNLLERGGKNGGIKVQDIIDSVNKNYIDRSINLYPSKKLGCCEKTAVFVSLESSLHIKKQRGHLSCKSAIIKLVQHMQGKCSGITNHAVLIVDSWNAKAVDEWRDNLNKIKSKAKLEIFFLSGGNVHLLNI